MSQNKNKIIDGRFYANELLEILKGRVSRLAAQGVIPKLAVVLVGRDPASSLYVRNKALKAESIGMLSTVLNLDNSVSEDQLRSQIDALNNDYSTHGIIVQMPLPSHINPMKILSLINPAKDVDGFHPMNVGKLYTEDSEGFAPCTPLGCMHLLKKTLGGLDGLHTAVIGRSQIAGRPLAGLLVHANCTVTICHSYTKNLADITKQADIVISATGKPGFLTAEYFKESAAVLDIGMNIVKKDNKVRFIGDVDFDNVIDKVDFITPVPGGVGPMTVAYLLSNTIDAAEKIALKSSIIASS